jgi:hypothetical protein
LVRSGSSFPPFPVFSSFLPIVSPFQCDTRCVILVFGLCGLFNSSLVAHYGLRRLGSLVISLVTPSARYVWTLSVQPTLDLGQC